MKLLTFYYIDQKYFSTCCCSPHHFWTRVIYSPLLSRGSGRPPARMLPSDGLKFVCPFPVFGSLYKFTGVNIMQNSSRIRCTGIQLTIFRTIIQYSHKLIQVTKLPPFCGIGCHTIVLLWRYEMQHF